MSARISSGRGSKQDYSTPDPLFRAIRRYFDIKVDLAAHSGNKKVAVYYGPGGEIEDSLEGNIWKPIGDWYFLNPPYNDIEPWYKKCAASMEAGARIVSLVPMDAAGWFDYVPGHAGIWHLKGRIKFDGATDSNTKDGALHIWDPKFVGQFRVWDWKKDKFLI